jgi:hypothetical protein
MRRSVDKAIAGEKLRRTLRYDELQNHKCGMGKGVSLSKDIVFASLRASRVK